VFFLLLPPLIKRVLISSQRPFEFSSEDVPLDRTIGPKIRGFAYSTPGRNLFPSSGQPAIWCFSPLSPDNPPPACLLDPPFAFFPPFDLVKSISFEPSWNPPNGFLPSLGKSLTVCAADVLSRLTSYSALSFPLSVYREGSFLI